MRDHNDRSIYLETSNSDLLDLGNLVPLEFTTRMGIKVKINDDFT